MATTMEKGCDKRPVQNRQPADDSGTQRRPASTSGCQQDLKKSPRVVRPLLDLGAAGPGGPSAPRAGDDLRRSSGPDCLESTNRRWASCEEFPYPIKEGSASAFAEVPRTPTSCPRVSRRVPARAVTPPTASWLAVSRPSCSLVGGVFMKLPGLGGHMGARGSSTGQAWESPQGPGRDGDRQPSLAIFRRDDQPFLTVIRTPRPTRTLWADELRSRARAPR